MPFSDLASSVSITDLPADVWRLIASRLSLHDLTALSCTSTRLRDVVTADELFRYFYLQNHRIPAASTTDTTSWRTLYRRSHALRKEPCVQAHDLQFKGPVRILARVADYVVIYCEEEQILRGFPGGWKKDVAQICEEKGDTAVVACCVQLLGWRLGFLRSLSGKYDAALAENVSHFTTLDMRTGEIMTDTLLPIGNATLSSVPTFYCMYQPKVLLLGGDHGQYLVYYVEHAALLRVFDHNNGVVVRNYCHSQHHFGQLVRSDCSETGSFIVRGIVLGGYPSEDGMRSYSISSLHDESLIIVSISIEDDQRIIDVVQSRDGRALVYRSVSNSNALLIWRMQLSGEGSGALAAKGRSWTWEAVFGLPRVERNTLTTASEAFVLEADGSRILLMPRGVRSLRDKAPDGRVFCIAFDKRDMRVSLRSRLNGFHPSDTLLSWATLCSDRRVLVICNQREGTLLGFDAESGCILWSVGCGDELRDVALVGEHYLMASSLKSGKIHLWHFGAFCAQPSSKCSLVTTACRPLLY